MFAGVELGVADSAIALLAHLAHRTPRRDAAVAGGWAAVESPLRGPGDQGAHLVAPRLASLVACSLPRAQLTTLAWRRAKRPNDRVAQEIAGLPDNSKRAAYVAEMLRAGTVCR